MHDDRSKARTRPVHWWFARSLVGVIVTSIVLGAASRADSPDLYHQVDFSPKGREPGELIVLPNLPFLLDVPAVIPPRPANGEIALKTLPERRLAVTSFLACGQELKFLHRVELGGAAASDDGQVGLSLAKLRWLSAGVAACERDSMIVETPPVGPQVNDNENRLAPGEADALQAMIGLGKLGGLGLNQKFANDFGAECDWVVTSVQSLGADLVNGRKFNVHFRLTPACLKNQVDVALRKVVKTGQLGSSGVPCNITGVLQDSQANWDFSLVVLMRILYSEAGNLKPDLRQHILQTLVPTEIKLGSASYWLTGCGDTENATGDATQRVPDSGNVLTDIGNTLGNVLNDVAHTPLTLAFIAATPVVTPLLAAVAAAAGTDQALQAASIPESENHRLLIETSRYLNNQLLQQELAQQGGNDGRLKTLGDAQSDVRGWLLGRMQDIFKNDFIEYNARPYQRESIRALLNLYDFADDANVRTAAGLVLEAAFAKYAAGSHEARRLVPFRRRMEAIDEFLEPPLVGGGDNGVNLLEPGSEADHQIPQGLLYSGQTQLTPQGFVANTVPDEIAFSAYSAYQPDPLVLDIAADKETAYLQRFRHYGFEAYSSGRGFLLTAGGVGADFAYTTAGVGDPNALGAGVPLTLMLSGGTGQAGGNGQASLRSFLRFDGLKEVHHPLSLSPFQAQEDYDHNACVDRGFACGMNLQVPPDLAACARAGPAGSEAGWQFIDSQACPGYTDGSPVFVAILDRPCGSAVETCNDFGVIEAVDAIKYSPVAFDAFIGQVLANNPPGSIPPGPPGVAASGAPATPLPRTYVTADGRHIDFDVTAHVQDETLTGLPALGNWHDLPRASGDLVSMTDGSVMTITNVHFPGHAVVLDFSDQGAPKRTDQ